MDSNDDKLLIISLDPIAERKTVAHG